MEVAIVSYSVQVGMVETTQVQIFTMMQMVNFGEMVPILM